MQRSEQFSITFAGVLAVHLMEFDYAGVHYSYHGRKLENTVKRLTAPGGPIPRRGDRKASTAELVIWGRASNDWKAMQRERSRNAN